MVDMDAVFGHNLAIRNKSTSRRDFCFGLRRTAIEHSAHWLETTDGRLLPANLGHIDS
jgi:hypothetical protein